MLFETSAGVLTLVATDRYRLAVGTTAADVEGPPARSVLPLSFVDELRPRLTGDSVVLDFTPDRVRAEPASIESALLDIDYPDHRRLLEAFPAPATRVTVDTAALRSRVEAAPVATREHEGTTYEVAVLGLDADGGVRLVPESEWDDSTHVGVNREFLLQALDAGAAGQLMLELDGPIKPLAVRVPGNDSRFSMLMPVRRQA